MPKQLAFETAEGFAAYAQGGRGGNVYQVTTLEDDKNTPGTLRHAIEVAERPLIVEFQVCGNIDLQGKNLKIDRGYITISGESAPGKGVAVVGGTVTIFDDEVIIRYLRFRRRQADSSDAMSIRRGTNIMIDHCSFSWGGDEVFTINPDETEEDKIHLEKVTVQNCFVYEAFGDGEGGHRFASILSGNSHTRISFIKNLIAHCDSRNPRMANRVETNWSDSPPRIDFRNNVVYNWGKEPGYNGEEVDNPVWMNYVKNVYLSGPSTESGSDDYIFEEKGSKQSRGYFFKNTLDRDRPQDAYDLVKFKNWSKAEIAEYENTSAFATRHTTTLSPSVVLNLVLAGGCVKPARDSADERIVQDVIDGTGTIVKNPDSSLYEYPNLQ